MTSKEKNITQTTKPKKLKILEKIERIKKIKAYKRIKENKNRFVKSLNKNKGRIFAGLGISAALTLSFRADDDLFFNTSKINVPITNNWVVMGKKQFSTDVFYRNLKSKQGSGVWYYSEKDAKPYNVNSNVNYSYLNNLRSTYNAKKTLIIKYENIYLSYKIDTLKQDTTSVICYMSEKLNNEYSSKILGYYQRHGREIVINNFYPDTTLSKNKQLSLLKTIEKDYDTKLIETETHELAHDENDQKGVNLRAGLGAERNYKLSKHDEVAANIKQLLKQRHNYILTGDEKYITGKFKFYLDAIKESKIKQNIVYVSLKEIEIIGKGVRDMWLNKFSVSYSKDHMKNLGITLGRDDIMYESIDANERYEKILKNIYKIKTHVGSTVNFRSNIEEFELTKKEIKEIEKIKKEKPLNEMDKLGMILDRYGHKAYHNYIVEQKKRVKEEDKRREQEQRKIERSKRNIKAKNDFENKNSNNENKDALVNLDRRIIQNRRQRRSNR